MAKNNFVLVTYEVFGYTICRDKQQTVNKLFLKSLLITSITFRKNCQKHGCASFMKIRFRFLSSIHDDMIF